MIRNLIAVLLIAGLLSTITACSSLSLGTALKLSALDVFKDDIASQVFAVDVPDDIRPLPGQLVWEFDASTKDYGNRNVKAVLVGAEADIVTSTLTPPGIGRTYYLLKISETDQNLIREAQTWARNLKAQHGTVGGEIKIAFSAKFCTTSPVNADTTRYSVLIALPGSSRMEKLVNNQKLSELLAVTGEKQLPRCL